MLIILFNIIVLNLTFSSARNRRSEIETRKISQRGQETQIEIKSVTKRTRRSNSERRTCFGHVRRAAAIQFFEQILTVDFSEISTPRSTSSAELTSSTSTDTAETEKQVVSPRPPSITQPQQRASTTFAAPAPPPPPPGLPDSPGNIRHNAFIFCD